MSSPPARELTTTSYAVLGLLAVRPWSTYELAKQMARNLRFFWPRAESNIYAEPKRLVEDGLAQSRSQPVGQRRRTLYTIKPAGRRVLERWLAEPAAPSRLESETLVKLMFSNYGTKEGLLEHVQRHREQVAAKQSTLEAIFDEYRRGEDPFPERLHVNVVAYRLLWEAARAEAAWATWALAEVERWPDVAAPADRSSLLEALPSETRSPET